MNSQILNRIPKIQGKLNTLYPNSNKKYHIPELKRPGIPYTQNPWPEYCFSSYINLHILFSSVQSSRQQKVWGICSNVIHINAYGACECEYHDKWYKTA